MLINVLSNHIKCNIYRISTTVDNANYPINEISVCVMGNSVRTVRSMLDGDRWEFYEEGDALPFENEELYKNRRIRKRINRETIVSYMIKLGMDINNMEFWQSETSSTYVRWLCF